MNFIIPIDLPIPLNTTSTPNPYLSISTTELEKFEQCPYLYKNINNHNLIKRTFSSQEEYNNHILKQLDTFQIGDRREEIANAYLYGEQLGDAVLGNRLSSRQNYSSEIQKQFHDRADLMKSNILKNSERFPITLQKKMHIIFKDTKKPQSPLINLTGTADRIFNDHVLEDCKTSKGNRTERDVSSKLQYKIYPRMYAIYKKGISIINSNEPYTFNYRIFTKHKKPRFQTVSLTSTYAETTEMVKELITKFYVESIKTRPFEPKESFKCKLCPLKKICPSKIDNKNYTEYDFL